MSNERTSHWDNIYGTKADEQVSWFQERPEPSLTLLALAGAKPSSAIIDIGAGASHLVDALLADGFEDLSVLDISRTALERDRGRLGKAAAKVAWICADVTDWKPDRGYDVWHDRAAFHFLTDPADQAAYAANLAQVLKPGGHAIIGTFAPDGPEKCSGLPIVRHDAGSIGAVLGSEFQLVDSRRHEHRTPWDSVQHFQFSTFRRSV